MSNLFTSFNYKDDEQCEAALYRKSLAVVFLSDIFPTAGILSKEEEEKR